MPALSTTVTQGAVIVHSQVDVDGDIGIQDGEDGMILSGLDVKPTRNKIEKTDHIARKVMKIYNTPVITLTLTGETTLNAALIPGSHPGTALTLAEFASLNTATCNGFPTDQGFLSIESNDRTGKQGDLWGLNVVAELCWLPTANIQVYRTAA